MPALIPQFLGFSPGIAALNPMDQGMGWSHSRENGGSSLFPSFPPGFPVEGELPCGSAFLGFGLEPLSFPRNRQGKGHSQRELCRLLPAPFSMDPERPACPSRPFPCHSNPLGTADSQQDAQGAPPIPKSRGSDVGNCSGSFSTARDGIPANPAPALASLDPRGGRGLIPVELPAWGWDKSQIPVQIPHPEPDPACQRPGIVGRARPEPGMGAGIVPCR